MIAVSSLPSINLSAAKESGTVLTTEEHRPTLQLLMLAGDSLGVYLYASEINDIENEYERSDRWQLELCTEDGYKGALQRHFIQVHAAGEQLLNDSVGAALDGDFLQVGKNFECVLRQTMARLASQQPETHRLIVPLRKAYKSDMTERLAQLRQQSEA